MRVEYGILDSDFDMKIQTLTVHRESAAMRNEIPHERLNYLIKTICMMVCNYFSAGVPSCLCIDALLHTTEKSGKNVDCVK